MYTILSSLVLSLILLYSLTSTVAVPAAIKPICQPSHTIFGTRPSNLFVPISPPGSYAYTSSGLELILSKPPGGMLLKSQKDGTNDRVAEGATFNSTFELLFGRVTIELEAPVVPGAVTAAILISDKTRDEIDVEILGSSSSQFQTNIFVPVAREKTPLYAVFSSIEDVHGATSKTHRYSVEWNANAISWGIDGREVRKITRRETFKNNAFHFPSHPARVQLGIWDASSPAGTSEWAGGPIDWTSSRSKDMKALIKSITVECPL